MMVVANVSIYIAVNIFGPPPPDTSGEYKNKEGAKNTQYILLLNMGQSGWVGASSLPRPPSAQTREISTVESEQIRHHMAQEQKKTN